MPAITLPTRSSFFTSDFASRAAVFGCIFLSSIATTPLEESMQRWPCRAADAARVVAGKLCAPRSGGTRITVARFYFLPNSRFLIWVAPDFPDFLDVRTGLAQPSPRMPHPRSLPCALHTSTRVHSTLDTHAARMRASPATCTCTHTATCAHTSKAFCGSSCHWPLADCRPARC